MVTETTVTLPITVCPREDGDGWRAEISIGATWAWGEGTTRYQAATDALHYFAWKLEELQHDASRLGPDLAREYADLTAWVEGGAGDGSAD